MSYLPPRILFRQHDGRGLSPRQALVLAESAIKEGRHHDAERLIEIVYDRLESELTLDQTRH